jgi:CDP-diacylglycerol--glycerol-3-phosphate 3-phosphatidyltransferase
MELARRLPNLLSAFRLAMVPVLLTLAWRGHSTTFLFAFALSLSSDVADGWLARKTGASSELGAKLDSWGDLSNYLVLPLCAWWLWPDRILAELAFVCVAGVAFLAPTLIGLLKFRRITSYHTRAAKLCAILMGAGLLIYLAFGGVCLFRVAVVLLVLEAIEEIAITTVLSEWRANVPSIFAALRLAKGGPALLVFALLPVLASAQQLPDLVGAVDDIHFEFGGEVDEGDVVEGCASAQSGLDLLRLSLITRNLGPGSIDLGDPGCPNCRLAENANAQCENPSFVCSPAGGHNHEHYQNFMRYELLDPNGVTVGLGGKRSFCLMETACTGSLPTHTCSDQGLNAGCYDLYAYYLGCQYIEINGLPSGDYTLRITMDPNEEIEETNEANNVLDTPVTISRADDPEVRVFGGELAIRPGKMLKFGGRPTGVRQLPTGSNDPTLNGALLAVFDTDEGWGMEFELPAAGWKAKGRPGEPRGFRYRGAGTDTDPCTLVTIGKRRLRAICKGVAIDQHLPAAGELAVQLHLGGAEKSEKRYCASFGGRTARNDVTGFRRRNAPAVACDSGL